MTITGASFIFTDTDLSDDDQGVDALISGTKWNNSSSNVLTYSFPDAAGDIGYTLGGGQAFANQLNAVQQATVRDVLSMISDVCTLDFVEIGDDPGEDNATGTLRYFDVTGISTAYAYYPSGGLQGGDSAYRNGSYENPVLGTYQYATFIHETGHALGLRHGHETGGPGAIPYDQDSLEYSVMTYRAFVGQNLDELPFYTAQSGSYPQSLMMLDIAALQRMYGADFTTNSGDTVYTFSTATGEMFVNGVGQGTPHSNKVFRTIWDGDGNDTYDFSNYTTRLRVDLDPGAYVDLDRNGNTQRAEINFGVGYNGGVVYSSAYEVWARGHVFNALQHNGDARSLIENAVGGSQGDQIFGNSADNSLYGNDGNDLLIGRAGNDYLDGGSGRDDLRGGSGDDLLRGSHGDDVLTGDTGFDRLRGENGNDTLSGGAGLDALFGGKGIDTFLFLPDMDEDRVIDFEPWDLIDVSAFGYVDFGSLMNVATDDGTRTTFDFGDGDKGVIMGMAKTDFVPDDFLFA